MSYLYTTHPHNLIYNSHTTYKDKTKRNLTCHSRTAAGSRPGGSRVSLLTKAELHTLSEELLRVDTGVQQPTLNEQGKTSGAATRDLAANP